MQRVVGEQTFADQIRLADWFGDGLWWKAPQNESRVCVPEVLRALAECSK